MKSNADFIGSAVAGLDRLFNDGSDKDIDREAVRLKAYISLAGLDVLDLGSGALVVHMDHDGILRRSDHGRGHGDTDGEQRLDFFTLVVEEADIHGADRIDLGIHSVCGGVQDRFILHRDDRHIGVSRESALIRLNRDGHFRRLYVEALCGHADELFFFFLGLGFLFRFGVRRLFRSLSLTFRFRFKVLGGLVQEYFLVLGLKLFFRFDIHDDRVRGLFFVHLGSEGCELSGVLLIFGIAVLGMYMLLQLAGQYKVGTVAGLIMCMPFALSLPAHELSLRREAVFTVCMPRLLIQAADQSRHPGIACLRVDVLIQAAERLPFHRNGRQGQGIARAEHHQDCEKADHDLTAPFPLPGFIQLFCSAIDPISHLGVLSSSNGLF